MNSNTKKLETFLSKLGFDPESDFKKTDIPSKIDIDLAYKTGELSPIYFKYLPESTLSKELFDLHQKIWNENKTEAFVVVSDNKTLLCASKYKPDKNNSLNCKIGDFSYGINSPDFETEKLEPLLKGNIDYGFFWDFVRKKIKERKRKSVDYDLLLNLIRLKESLERELSQEKSYILIERCLFLKFLEDRTFLLPKALLNILKSKDSQKLLIKFDEVNKSLNGNVFDETIFIQKEISQSMIDELYDFFTTDYRNKYKQIKLFPYRFDIIPIELLSNIYEAFLKTTDQKKNGVYYTPSNLVDLVLNKTLELMLKKNSKPACLDFACGSGIFLVKSLERLIDKNNCRKDFEKKKSLLKNCIFGVEKDPVATRITIFSLYLTLLEGEDPANIRQLIKSDKIKFPKLFNKNILCKNTLFAELNFVNDDNKKFEGFDVIVGNPPWGVNLFAGAEDEKEMKLLAEKQEVANKDQSSQYFILKAEDFMKDGSIAGIVFNNSNLLMGQAEKFRKRILEDYTIKIIYELTKCNPILFKKQRIEDLEIGANEPVVAMIFHKKIEGDGVIKYITPSLDALSKFLRIIGIKSSEIKDTPQNSLLENDQLWRILSIGDMEDYRLIKKMESQKENIINGLIGFQPTDSEKYKVILRDAKYADKDCISPFVLKKDYLKKTPEQGIKIRRVCSGCNVDTKEFTRKKLFIKRFIERGLRITASYDNTGYRFKDNLLGLISDYDHRLMLSFYNSSLVSYFLYFNSAQIGKGTWNMLHKNEIENVPIPLENNIPAKYKNKLIALTEKILKIGYADTELVSQIDEIIFDIYHLKEFEKQRIRDFFNVHYRDKDIKVYVAKDDLQKYVNRFRDVFRFILKDDKYLNAKGYISSSIGTGIIFILVDKKEKQEGIEFLNVADIKKFTQIVSKKQLDDSQRNKILKQEKIKIYDKNQFVIIKSNQFKDWTETEAIKDANEEIGEWLKYLPTV